MSFLALADSFEYLCYGSMAIINIFILTATFVVRIWRDVRFWRQKSIPVLWGLMFYLEINTVASKYKQIQSSFYSHSDGTSGWFS